MSEQQKLFEQLAVAQRAYSEACDCGCVCHVTKVSHANRCCFASMTLRNEIKEDIDRLNAEIRRLENGRIG